MQSRGGLLHKLGPKRERTSIFIIFIIHSHPIILLFDNAGGGADGQSSSHLLLHGLGGDEGAAHLELLPLGALRAERQGMCASALVYVLLL